MIPPTASTKITPTTTTRHRIWIVLPNKDRLVFRRRSKPAAVSGAAVPPGRQQVARRLQGQSPRAIPRLDWDPAGHQQGNEAVKHAPQGEDFPLEIVRGAVHRRHRG